VKESTEIGILNPPFLSGDIAPARQAVKHSKEGYKKAKNESNLTQFFRQVTEHFMNGVF